MTNQTEVVVRDRVPSGPSGGYSPGWQRHLPRPRRSATAEATADDILEVNVDKKAKVPKKAKAAPAKGKADATKK